MPGVSWRCWGGWARRADRQGRSLGFVYVDLMTSANANARVRFAGFDRVVRITVLCDDTHHPDLLHVYIVVIARSG